LVAPLGEGAIYDTSQPSSLPSLLKIETTMAAIVAWNVYNNSSFRIAFAMEEEEEKYNLF
jgi:hypothetical protein